MAKTLELNGLKFDRWSVGEKSETRDKYGNVLWNCTCECGTIRLVIGTQLKQGESKSCGCLTWDVNSARETIHGLSRTKHSLYPIWQGIKTRCYNKNSYAYKDYGGRGIKICDSWVNNFIQFREDMIDTFEIGLTIERINTNGHYEKSNCRWATRLEQAKNRRSTIWIETIQGKMTVQDACKIAGISWPAMRNRMNFWPIEKLLIPATIKGRV